MELVDTHLHRTGQGTFEDRIRFVRDRAGHDRRYAMDTTKIKHELSWRPAHTFEQGMERTVAWYLDHPDWVESIQTGAYQGWIQRNYRDRDPQVRV